jgi:membrane associated rhomboid family serine protease
MMFQAATAGLLGGQGGVGWRLDAIRDYGVREEVARFMWQNGIYPPEELLRLVTYPLIHTGFVHAGFVVVFVLAIGKMVAEVFSPLAFVALFLVSAVAGALGFVILMNSPFPLVGGYPAVYGLIGAFTFIMWTQSAVRGSSRYRAFGLIGALLAIQLIFGVIQGDFGNVVADLSGFVAGFAMSFLIGPGGWRRALALLRTR